MIYNKLNETIIQQLKLIVVAEDVLTDSDNLEKYGQDETEDFIFKPEVVVKPKTVSQISEVMKLANTHKIPVTARGSGTGLSGGALPIHGGIIISMERFNNILQIDERNLQATVEPGVINYIFQEEVKKYNQFFGDFEQVKRYQIVPEEWTQPAGFLSPTLKIKRKVLEAHYADRIEKLFS